MCQQLANNLWEVEGCAIESPTSDSGEILGIEEDEEDYAFECAILALEYHVYGSIRVFFRTNKVYSVYGVAFH
ncbi:MAG: hypothetical protein PHD88_09540 [Firmicutes bacterium]|nr:hypothetical protein [Bacillota bacterium]MDD4263741.1 hypothetical protein [Bacillota bacterium]MDD4694605.1 hypothetical protein [Bacillota bacterium]